MKENISRKTQFVISLSRLGNGDMLAACDRVIEIATLLISSIICEHLKYF
jgi:hypothetical protein